jgi:copper chaperone CopZ
MRQRLVAIVGVIGLLGFPAGSLQAEKITVKDIHLCCDQCEKSVGEALKKVQGVSEVKCDQKTKVVTFTSTDATTSAKALSALFEAGFSGKPIGRLPPNLFGARPPKTDEVMVKGVHVCCKGCEKAIDALFKNATVSYSGTGPQKDLKITGKDLNKNEIWEALMNAGFACKFK